MSGWCPVCGASIVMSWARNVGVGWDAHLNLQELLQTNSVCLLGLFQCFPLRLEHEAWRQCVPILAIVAVGTFPEPSKPAAISVTADTFHETYTHFSVSMA